MFLKWFFGVLALLMITIPVKSLHIREADIHVKDVQVPMKNDAADFADYDEYAKPDKDLLTGASKIIEAVLTRSKRRRQKRKETTLNSRPPKKLISWGYYDDGM